MSASKGSAAAASNAAGKTFAAAPSLLVDQATLDQPGEHDGRRRLGGAYTIELRRIRPDPAQPRKNLETAAQQELLASVRRLGLLQPITVRYIQQADVFQIISGERRFQAANAAGLSEIPCWVQTPDAKEVLLRQIVENWQRADLQPYELADALAILRDANNYSQKDLARETGKPESEISRLLSLLKVDPTVQELARKDQTGMVTKRHLFAIAQMPAAQQADLLTTIRKDRLTAKDTERLVRDRKARLMTMKPRGRPVARRVRYITSKATVTLDFRTRDVPRADILAALDEARDQASKTAE